MKTMKRFAAALAGVIALSATGSAHATWRFFQPGPSNYSRALDVTEGLVCAEVGIMSGNGDNQVLCSSPSGSSGFTSGMWLNNGNALPGGVDSLAIFNSKTNYGTYIHVLGNDDVVRTYNGNQSIATWYSQPGFVNPVSTAQPIDVDTGATINIVDIAAVYAGWLGFSRHEVLAVTSGGLAYTKYGSKWRKHPRLNTLGVTFKRVSSQKPSGDSYWVTSTGEIYRAFDMNSSPGPTLNKVSPTYSGRIRDIGFPYLLTNAGGSSACNPLTQACYVTCTVANTQCQGDADRVQKLIGNTWTRYPTQYANYNPGMPGSVPVPPDGSAQDLFGPKNGSAIVDGYPFRGTSGEYFIHHYSTRWYVWIP